MNIRIFRCLCFPNLSATTFHKIPLLSTSCVFLGYSANHRGYRCLEFSSNKIIISRHVMFDESNFSFSDILYFRKSDYKFLRSEDPYPIYPLSSSAGPYTCRLIYYTSQSSYFSAPLSIVWPNTWPAQSRQLSLAWTRNACSNT